MRLLRKALFKERAGNTAMIFALLTPVLVLLGGGAVDLTNASMRQSALQQAADAAAVGAVARSSPAYQAALLMTGNGTVTAPNMQANALAIFNANRRDSGDTSNPTFSVTVVKTGLTVSSTVTASMNFSPNFLGLIGNRSIALAANSYASDNIPAYVNFHLLLDNSPSMALPATSGDIARMIAMTANNTSYPSCAFACHATDPGSAYQNLSVYATSPTDGGPAIATRIQVVRQSAQQLFSKALSIEQQNGVPAEFQMAVYDFGPQAMTSPSLSTYIPLNYNLNNTSQANGIDVMTVPSENQAYNGGNNDEDTDITSMLTQLYKIVDPTGTTVGNGYTPASPQQVIFLISDGFTDANNCNYDDGGLCREERPIGVDSAECSTIKSKGISIAILYTTYLPLDDPSKPPIDPVTNKPKPSWYDQYVAPFETSTPTQINQAMQACASPGLFAEVSPNEPIPDAMNQLFNKIVASVKITR